MALLDDKEAAAETGAPLLSPEQLLPAAADASVTAQPSSATVTAADARVATSTSIDSGSPPATASDVVDRLFRGTVCLAPMVRAGTLPFRLLCLSYGADVVWGEEIIDRKMLACERRPNPRLGTIDFVNQKDGRLVFQTSPAEKGRVIFQLGASPRNPEWAVRAALLVAGDVAGVDVNMGCPKKFSVQDGMGAALLENEAGAAGLIRALRAALPPHVPVTCKIRLLDTPERTLAFARAMQQAGCAAIGVHMRTRTDKATGAARWDAIQPVVEGLTIPVVANGDIYTHEHLAAVRAAAGSLSDLAVMLARPALYNPSVFRTLKQTPQELVPLDEAMRAFVRLCLRCENHVSNTKYILCEMLCRKRHPDHLRNALPIEPPPGKTIPVLSTLKTSAAIAALWGLDPETEGPAGRAATAAAAAAAEAQERPGLHVYSDAYLAGAAEGSAAEGDGAAGVGAKRGLEPTGEPEANKRARAD